MKTKLTNLEMEENETVVALKPKKLFAITLLIYSILVSLIAVACFFIKYPVNYTGQVLSTTIIDNDNSQLNFSVKKDIKFDVYDQLTITDQTGYKYLGTITTIDNSNPNLSEVSVKLSPVLKKPIFIQHQNVELTQSQKLFFVLVKQLN